MLKENNKIIPGIFLAVAAGAIIVGGAIYFSSQEKGKPGSPLPLVQCPAPSKVMATKIIDGDTIIVEGGYHVRLLGIDADERDYPCYEPAKNRLEELILNKEIKLEKDITDVDQYKRCLRYVFLDKQNIDLELVKEGLTIARFYEPDIKYKDEITSAEKTAIENKIGCKWNGENVSGGEEKTNFLWEKLTPEKTGLKVIDACQGKNYSGKEIIAEGKISGAYRSKTNTIFLNFEKPYPNQCFTSVIFSSDQYKFVQSPEKYYSQKTVRIRGEIKEYQRKPEIILKDPGQIEIGK
ncbi:hypothetical protein COY65_02640 [Candidatus Jorgensenbacteria bacterium CG_4_10_14_0_8_um_filter_39_13]|uniref:TNase-like domain-containing protein n=2 Tax=Candidatus Joergenseniibacteriota TaxID=1752739 RepID=A0A2M7RFZ1_9BACT|nr:MAG: hypothetical protein COV54_01565 [Candidatus Jorgensenbacteria bacterium CG11_big_fil_rev_8_21_14_0_20_38_23]PIV13380.1 MAG: hypothetical protein COS46_00510 [Candidatus Jorgensenbacteria bacterium CG03_land_8_20_14_0_80_38_39]PIW97390.1 MAG: hypothetical protein COZ81_02805 [Candidatus Jorgensenbacteria bacterium CG_4_8_14_3_um_filter_38_10]PIY95659.1 MAG: hypothetical protein COY65_02640 [Candidatus Jorgensenbacteria bacterium CG_4_10_14_0_8_um_filter_39_13]PJA94852.1 MAG: hypothetica